MPDAPAANRNFEADVSGSACVACREPIRSGARICPHCGSSQKAEGLKIVGTVLKWVGGVTAVVSLVIGTASVQELYESWRQRESAIAELVAAAKIQQESRDYEGGWLLLKEALELEPASENVRRFQIPFAMEWLRHVRVPEGKSFATVVDPLLPVLYRGAADERTTVAADVYAHIGWANYLKRRAGNYLVEIDAHFARALKLDPGNAYANAFAGHWTLNPVNPSSDTESAVAQAERHFEIALKSDRDREFVANLTLAALLGSSRNDAVRASLNFLDLLRTMGVPVSVPALERAKQLFRPIASQDPQNGARKLAVLVQHMPADSLRRLYGWIDSLLPPQRGSEGAARRFIAGRLAEETGDTDAALAAYRAIAADGDSGSAYVENVVRPAIRRLDPASRQ